MNRIELDLSFKRIKNQKKYSLLILFITILACILVQTGFQMSSGIQNTFLENRKDIYGEWDRILLQLDSQSETMINENPFIEQKGKIEIYGILGGEYTENKQANIGTIDETAWKIGRMKLIDGRLPRNENEIAMEYSMLSALGYDDSLGKEISFNVIPSVDIGNEYTSSEYTYTLCGIIKDYQINWETCSRNRLPTGIVTPKGGQRIGKVLETQMLLKAKPEYDSVYKDLENSKNFFCKMEENFNQGSLITDNIPYKNFLNNITLLITGAAICILFVTIAHSIDTRRNLWKLLNALGMKKIQMHQMIFWEASIYFTISIMIGTIGGIILYQMTLPFFEVIIGKEIIKRLSPKATFTGILLSALIIGISYFFSCIRLNIILKGSTKKQRKHSHKKAHTLSRFTPLAIVIHRWQYASIRKIIQILLLSSTFVIVGFGLFEITDTQNNLKLIKQTTGNGYYLDTNSIPNSSGIRKNIVQSISQIAGVESIETYYTNDAYKTDFTVNLSDHANSKYLQKVVETEQMYIKDISIEDIRLNVLGIVNWKDLNRFLNNISEGSITKNEFDQGDFCILLLPPLEKTPMGYLGNSAEESFKKSFLMEDTIKVGDCLRIVHHKTDVSGNTIETEEKQIQVDAILRTSKSSDLCSPYPGGSGISIITGSKFWNIFSVDTVNEYYQQVKILVSDDADSLDTEKHILRILKKTATVNLTNYHAQYSEKQKELYSFIGMFSIFTVFYMILVFIILYQMMETETHESKKKMMIFKLLGMEDDFIRKIQRTELLLLVSFSASVSAVLFVCYYIVKIMSI